MTITKEEILHHVRELATKGIASKEEVVAAYDAGRSTRNETASETKHFGLTEVLYYIGGGIVFLGIFILIAQNWNALGVITKILTTLGVGLAAYVIGAVFTQDLRTKTAAFAFFLISALVTPIGLWVVLDSAGIDAGSAGALSLIYGIMLAAYLATFFAFRKNMFVFFNIVFGTLLFFSFTSWLAGDSLFLTDQDFHMYRVLAIGISYMLMGYAFSNSERAPLSGVLYGFGIFAFLGSALVLGGWKPDQNIFWELIYPVLVFGTLFVSVYLKSKAFLTWGTIFLMAYILKITGEYFSSGLGWPFALVIAGLAMIGIGYMSLRIKNTYIETSGK